MDRGTNRYCIFETAGGFCGILWNDRGIVGFQLPTRSAETTERLLLRRAADAAPGEPTSETARAIAAVKDYFDGKTIDFSDFRIDLGGADDLFRPIYESVRRIGWGETTTYGALAKTLGQEPQFARDVGQAMAKNPIPLIIPCHRVLAAGGKVGGFSAPGGARSKIRMLELEGVRLGADDPDQPSLAL